MFTSHRLVGRERPVREMGPQVAQWVHAGLCDPSLGKLHHKSLGPETRSRTGLGRVMSSATVKHERASFADEFLAFKASLIDCRTRSNLFRVILSPIEYLRGE